MEVVKIKFYFVFCGEAKAEWEAIKVLKPPRLLMSYHYWRNKDLKEVCEILGYRPKIILDSGAYTAWNKSKPIDFEKYKKYIKRNFDYIEHYVCLDVVNDFEKTFINYKQMLVEGFKPLPVIHFGDDEKHLQKYVDMGVDYIALGGAAKRSNKEVVEWINFLFLHQPHIGFHVLGKGNDYVLSRAANVISADASTWIIGAALGRPKHIAGGGIENITKRAIYNMDKTIKKGLS